MPPAISALTRFKPARLLWRVNMFSRCRALQFFQPGTKPVSVNAQIPVAIVGATVDDKGCPFIEVCRLKPYRVRKTEQGGALNVDELFQRALFPDKFRARFCGYDCLRPVQHIVLADGE